MREDGRQNPIVTRSKAALVAAATELLDGHDPSAVSITQVVQAAGMSRPTFYQHFSDLGALFAEAGIQVVDRVFAAVPVEPSDDGVRLGSVSPELIRRMEEHAGFLHRVETGPGGAEFHARVVSAVVARLRGEAWLRERIGDDEAAWEFLAAGAVWSVTRHLAAYCEDPESESRPAEDLARIVRGVVGGIAPSPSPHPTARATR